MSKYNKERIHKLFLECCGDISSVMQHKATPRSRKTIRKYAKDGGWDDELVLALNEGGKNQSLNSESNGIEKLEKIKSVIYQFLVSEISDEVKELGFKPKTYAEAVKCYLEIDSRIDEKKTESSNSVCESWENIIKHLILDK